MPDQLVVGRLKGSDQLQFTKSCSPHDLLKACLDKLPVDLVYIVVPDPDGKGYSLREAGQLTLDLQPAGLQGQPAPSTPPVPVGIDAACAPQMAKVDAAAEKMMERIAEDLYAFDDLEHIPRPQPQSALLAALGLEQPPVVNPTVSTPKKKRSKAKPEPLEANDDDLPHPVSKSTRKVRSISTATPAEAAAAGKNFSGLK